MDEQIISWTVCKELVCMFDRVGRCDAVELAEMTLSMGLRSSHGESSLSSAPPPDIKEMKKPLTWGWSHDAWR